MKRKKKADLPALLERKKAVPAAVKTLIECLTATRTYQSNGRPTTEPDFATRAKAALGILEWAASPPPRLSAKDVALSGPKLTQAELDAEQARILGVEFYDKEGLPIQPVPSV